MPMSFDLTILSTEKITFVGQTIQCNIPKSNHSLLSKIVIEWNSIEKSHMTQQLMHEVTLIRIYINILKMIFDEMIWITRYVIIDTKVWCSIDVVFIWIWNCGNCTVNGFESHSKDNIKWNTYFDSWKWRYDIELDVLSTYYLNSTGILTQ